MVKDQIVKPSEFLVKIVLACAALAITFSLAACGGGDSGDGESKKFQRYGEGQENLETRSHIKIDEEESGSGPKRESEIGSQLDADELVKIGMPADEIIGMIRPVPEPPWMEIGFRDSGSGDQISLDVTADDGTAYSLTTEPKDGAPLSADTAQVRAFIFFSSIQPNADLTVIFFGDDDRVSMMSKVPCDDVVEMVAVGNQGDRIPPRSACSPD